MRGTCFILPLCLAWAVMISSVARAEITIALVGGLSGQFESIGEAFRQGTNGAVSRINANGGLLGEPLVVVERDDECNPEKARAIAEELSGIGVDLVIGHLCSGASIAASEIYAENDIIQISPSSTAPEYTDRGLMTVFRTCGRDDMQGFVIAEHLIRQYRTKNIAIIHDTSFYSDGLAKLTKGFLARAGVNESLMAEVDKGHTDFGPVLDDIVNAKIDVVFFPSYAEPVSALLAQARERNMDFTLVSGDTLMNADFINIAGNLADGVELAFPPDPAHDRRNRKLNREFRANGFEPEAFTYYNYAAVEVWSQAVAKIGTTEASAVSKQLRSAEFETVLGSVTFDEKGDISQPGFVMYTYVEGRPEYWQ